MRDIKFRAWDAIEAKMWCPIIRPDGRLMASNRLGGYVTFDDPQDPLMQFTGLHDKNGNEIYEGDIVKWEPDWVKSFEKPKSVEYRGSGFDPFQYDGGGEWDALYCVVIGNIYENPELLK